jgi:hypothetical protein
VDEGVEDDEVLSNEDSTKAITGSFNGYQSGQFMMMELP